MFGRRLFGNWRSRFGQTGAPPLLNVIASPVGGSAYSTSITLQASTTDPDADRWYPEWWYSADAGVTWTFIGNGPQVASGASSQLAWNISAVTPGVLYQVRARAIDPNGRSTGYAVTTSFTIGASSTSIYASPNTARYYASPNTAAFYATKA